MEVTVIPIVIVTLGTIIKESVKGLEDMEIRERVKSLRDLRSLAATQTLVKNHQLMLE